MYLQWLTTEITRTFDMVPIGNLCCGSMGNWAKVTVGLCRAVVSLQYVQGVLLLMDFT